MVKKTKEVLKYLENRDYNSPLDKIYNQINSGEKTLHIIYITDKYLTIVNTTFEYDKGFNFSFAKNLFMKHKKEKIFEIEPSIRSLMRRLREKLPEGTINTLSGQGYCIESKLDI